jgi:hypothetical protein
MTEDLTDTRHEGQVVWLDCGSYARSIQRSVRTPVFQAGDETQQQP